MSSDSPLAIYGAIITPQSHRVIRYLPNALIYVEKGIIQWIEEEVLDDTHLETVLKARGLTGFDIIRLRKGEFVLPGFIDTHTHAPQFPNLGRGGQYELLDWLSNLTFPTESRFGDRQYAQRVYNSVVRRLLDCGTTTCCYYSTTHLVGTKVLADVVNTNGQRAFIGYCNLDRNAPTDYMDSSPVDSIANTRSTISYIKNLDSPLIRPILTPRFAIGCTSELLKGLGDLAAENPSLPQASAPDASHHSRLPIQTHISENASELLFTASLFPSHSSYASIYEDHGLLGPTTILAHGCHLSPDEIKLIKKSGAGISHCPTSNFNLCSGVAKVGGWLDEGVKVGLGTDVSGGFSPSMLTAIQHASMASKVVALEAVSSVERAVTHSSSPSIVTPAQTLAGLAESAQPLFANRPLPTATLLFLATLGGAQLCNLENHIGSIAPGKAFDALLVNLRRETGNPNVWWYPEEESEKVDSKSGHVNLEASLEKFLFCGDDRNISAVYVQGRLVGGCEFANRNRT